MPFSPTAFRFGRVIVTVQCNGSSFRNPGNRKRERVCEKKRGRFSHTRYFSFLFSFLVRERKERHIGTFYPLDLGGEEREGEYLGYTPLYFKKSPQTLAKRIPVNKTRLRQDARHKPIHSIPSRTCTHASCTCSTGGEGGYARVEWVD